ncbi:MAG: efflux RND transporter periplasmic adaptor subunit [Burkholderiaceae bacterium]|nr:efflux RND transporter periplasmic adaptor subunit [Burkholderiaceae bacterium]
MNFPSKPNSKHLHGSNYMSTFDWRNALLLLIVSALAACSPSENKKGAGNQSATAAAKPATEGAGKKAESEDEEGEEGKLALTPEQIKAAGIIVAELVEQDVSDQITVTATITADQNKLAHIAPRVAGKLTRVLVDLGDKVKAGQSLALIDSIEVGEAQSSYAQAASEHDLAVAGMERAQKLFAEQIIPQKDYLRARADVEKTKAVLRAADEKRHALGLAGQGAQGAGRSVFPVSAPFHGTVIEKQAVVGELAQPDKSLFSVADLSRVWIETNLYEKDLGAVRTGAPATITVAAYPGKVFKGKVSYISSVMDKESRTIHARVELANTDGLLKLGMFATASIAAQGTEKALLLPDDAVVLIQGQPTAFVLEEGGYEARAVSLGEKLHGKVILKSGIEAGEKVVTSGAYALKARILKSQIGDAD